MNHILMVCLGNICRSPLAEGILKNKLTRLGLPGHVESAGTAAYHVGERPDIRSQEIALKHGIDIGNQRARRFKVGDFDRFDAIYAMDRSNYSDILALARSKQDAEKVHLILNLLYPNENKQVPDPYYGGKDGFQNVYDMLDSACERIVGEILIKDNDKQ